MSELKLCQQCGSPIPQTGELAGSCPHCMLELAFESWDGRAEPSEFVSAANGEKCTASLSHFGTIGRYRILGLIGEGGMGAVYEAEQDTPRRTVALKIIRPAMATPELLRRFEQESQALGRLQHPGIAQIYEAGTVDTGFGPQPYFAMEFVRGRSPWEYAEAHNLTTSDRLEMVAKICDGVHHAHLRGLIHRDLKPGNILVDDTGQPKILDFGVARVTDSDARATQQTDVGQLVGTLAYMSPEQALADPLGLDIRTDVYALGVILHELLSGQLPYPISKKIHETIQTIREQDPMRLGAVNRSYRGDIETIVAKALEKDKVRRYGSAAELAADIRRYLSDEPIVARPPNVGYQLRKFARRQKAIVMGVAAVFVVLLGGVVTSTWQAQVARHERDRFRQANEMAARERDRANANEQAAERERDRAEAETNRALDAEERARTDRDNAVAQKIRADTEAGIAKAVQEFLGNDLLRMANPVVQTRPADSRQTDRSGPPNPNLTIKELLDRAARNIGNRFEKQPLVEAAIRETIAETYFGIGLYDNAREHFEKAAALRGRAQGPDSPSALKTMVRVASSLSELRQWREAETLIEDIMERGRRSPDNQATLEAIELLVSNRFRNWMLQPGASRAENLLRDFISRERQSSGSGNEVISEATRALVTFYEAESPPRYAEAEALLKGLIDDQRRKLGDDNSATIFSVRQLVNVYVSQAQFAKAESLLKPLVEQQRRKLGDNNQETLAGIIMLARVLMTQPQPKYAEAEALLKSVYDKQVRGPGGGNSGVISTVNQLAELYIRQNRYPEAEKLLAPIVMAETGNNGLKDPLRSSQDTVAIAKSFDHLLQVYTKLGRTQDAEALAGRLKAFLETTIASSLTTGADYRSLSTPINTLAGFAAQFWRQGRDKEADEIVRTALEGYRKIARSDPTDGAIPGMLLAAASSVLGTPARHDQLEKLANDILEIQREELGDSDPATANTLAQLAQIYAGQRRYVEAEETYQRVIGARRDSLGITHPVTRDAMVRLWVLYTSDYRYQKAQGQAVQAKRAGTSSLPFLKTFLELERTRSGADAAENVARLTMSTSTAHAIAGDYAEAERLYNQFVAWQREVGAASVALLGSRITIAWLQSLQGKYESAETDFREICGPGTGTQRIDCWNLFGATLAAQKKFEEAEPLLLRAYERRPLNPPRLASGFVSADYSDEAQPGERLLKLYEDWGKPEKVKEFRERLEADKTRISSNDLWQVTGVPNPPWTFNLLVEGTSMTGFVAMNPTMLPRADIYEGKVEGNIISFKVTSPDTLRTISFTAKMNGNEIGFTRTIQFRNGASSGPPGQTGVFGVEGAKEFVARRVQ